MIKQSIFLLVVYAGSAFVIASGVDYVLKNIVLKDEYVTLNPSQRDLLRLVTQQAIIITGIFTAMKIAFDLGFNELAVSFGLVSLVTSLALKHPLENLIATLAYQFTSQYKVGDRVRLILDPTNTIEGKVIDRDAFTFRLETEDGRRYKIPSGFLVSRPLTLLNETQLTPD